MTTIAIVTSTGNYLYDQVLRGVYGTAAAKPEAPDALIFTPAPEFRRVSHLFTQLPQIPVRASGIEMRDVPDADADIAKAQILFGLGARWASLYAARASTQEGAMPDIGQALLAGEGAAVARGVREHLESVGMNVYEVPVLVKGEVHSHGSYLDGAATMIGSMRAKERTIEVDPAGRARVLVRSALTGDARAIEAARLDAHPAEIAPAPTVAPAPMAPPVRSFIRSFFDGPGAQPEEAPQAQAPEAVEQPARADITPDAWRGFQGVDATVRALMYVVAPNLEALPRAIDYMHQAYKNDAAGLHLEPVDVAAVRDLQREDLALSNELGDEDFQDSGYDTDR